MSLPLHRRSIAALAAGLRAREFSSEELTRHFLDRIARHQEGLNAFITVTAATALEAARAADRRLAAGTGGALEGIPIAHKDIFCTRGVRTSCGSRMLDNFIAPYDATVVSRLAEAGAVMLGKTNMDEFAMGSSNETSWYGPVHNPWDTDTVPGGSSGGSAAAVAARLAPVATATDTGGSIRQPAAFCGVSGLKPTYGAVSRHGMIAFASSLDQGGPIAASAEDIAWILAIMGGHDARDSTSLAREFAHYPSRLGDEVAGLRIGLPRAFFDSGLDPAVARVVEEAIDVFRRLGAQTVEVDLPNNHLSVPAYYVVAPAECSSNLARYDGVRFGYRCESPRDLMDLYKRTRGEGFGAEVKRRIMIGTYVLSSGYYDAYYLKAQQLRRLISADFAAAFDKVDVIMGPTTPETAFRFGAKTRDPLSMYLSDIYTSAVNLAGLPGMSIPCGFSAGMPVGLQIIGNYFGEARLLSVAHRFQQETDWHARVPEAYA